MKLILTIGFTIISLIGFSQWEVVSEGVDSEWNHYKIDFINKDTGIVLGSHSTVAEPLYKYYVLKTYDGGITFDTMMYQNNTKQFLDVHFYNDTLVYLLSKACCNERIEILKSTDAGDTWNVICDSITVGGTNYYSMQFTSPNKGVVTAFGWSFYTNDGGINWTRTNYYNGTRSSSKYGDTIALSNSSLIIHSTSLFNTYDSINVLDYNIDFIGSGNVNIFEDNNIIIGGYGIDGFSQGYSHDDFSKIVVLNVQDFHIKEVDFESLYDILDIKSTNNRLYLSTWAYQNSDDLILMSDNGGETWHRSEIIDNNGIYSLFIQSIDFVNDNVGYAAQNSTLYKTTNAGGPLGTQVGTIIQGATSLSEHDSPLKLNVHPNPTNNIINVETPVNSKIKMYNVSGKLIKSYTQTSNKTQVDVSNIPSGIYILTVLNDAGSVTRKIVID